jgi:uncharacterized protein with FMN-binding domain
MKRKMTIIAIIVGVLLVIAVGGFTAVDRATKSATKDIVVYTQNASGIPDGTYAGSYEISPVRVVVQVKVENGNMAGIDILEHRNGLGGKAERIVDDVLEQQSLSVDAVSGATASSRTILKAVENALQSGENR